ncbi:MAG: hypothetical protein H0T12_08200 [Actinobacteria bacterium]|nr:hypothetical protein [Actinomycetota bacterium]
MPPAPHKYQGPVAIAAFLHASAAWRSYRQLRLVPTRASTQPAFHCYLSEGEERTAHPAGLLVITLSGDRISAITRFLDNDLQRRLELHQMPFTTGATVVNAGS